MGERLTALLARAQDGDKESRDALFAAAYSELRRVAHARLRKGGANTLLNTTALVHDSYLRLVQVGELRLDDRKAFFAYASRVMRSVIVDSARERLAQRRGGGAQTVTLCTELAQELRVDDEGIVKVNDALLALEAVDARVVRMVEMRVFGGYNEAEIAEALGVTDRTVQRDWIKAKAMLGAMFGAPAT